jgi:hypothetical protein
MIILLRLHQSFKTSIYKQENMSIFVARKVSEIVVIFLKNFDQRFLTRKLNHFKQIVQIVKVKMTTLEINETSAVK